MMTWIDELHQFVFDRTSCGEHPIDDAVRPTVVAIINKHADEINEVRYSPPLTREEFLQTVAACLDGYPASKSCDALLTHTELYIWCEIHPTAYENYWACRALRVERADDRFPPTFNDIRKAYLAARRRSRHFALILENIYRMMDGKWPRGIDVGDADDGLHDMLPAPDMRFLEYDDTSQQRLLEHHEEVLNDT